MNSHLGRKRRTLFFASKRESVPNHQAWVVGVGPVYNAVMLQCTSNCLERIPGWTRANPQNDKETLRSWMRCLLKSRNIRKESTFPGDLGYNAHVVKAEAQCPTVTHGPDRAAPDRGLQRLR